MCLLFFENLFIVIFFFLFFLFFNFFFSFNPFKLIPREAIGSSENKPLAEVVVENADKDLVEDFYQVGVAREHMNPGDHDSRIKQKGEEADINESQEFMHEVAPGFKLGVKNINFIGNKSEGHCDYVGYNIGNQVIDMHIFGHNVKNY